MTPARADDGGHGPEEPNDGGQSLFSLTNGERLQLMSLSCGLEVSDSVALVPLGLDGFDRIEAVYRLLASLHGRVIPPDKRLTRPQRRRHRTMLQAYDGRRCGATLLEIARVLYRVEPMSRDEWQMSSHRYGVMSLLREANALVAGGYRKLLRHRRRT
ncbi:DUF2285 domain-containing protein [uncultured Roseibium sp.]|uniref:DUF2285 domain-containing protein n=1 Tax=uncultured Roseibium sp. TaxID=1936171 RepID=UPI0026067846|nr:DUF2285 domain-containing protein [uncultured Roseibium sp.]